MSAPSGELDLSSLRAALAGRAVLIRARAIRDGDERAFFQAAANSSPVVRSRDRASGAARIAARELLAELGANAGAELPRLPSRAPGWPSGLIGSLAHDDAFAIAAVARTADLAALGVDIEPCRTAARRHPRFRAWLRRARTVDRPPRRPRLSSRPRRRSTRRSTRSTARRSNTPISTSISQAAAPGLRTDGPSTWSSTAKAASWWWRWPGSGLRRGAS